MDALLTLLIQGVGVALVDVDNAMYTTKRISGLKSDRRLALGLSLALEFIGRLVLLFIFLSFAGAQRPLFELFGIQFTLETISLFVAGFYLLISNGRELIAVVRNPNADANEPATAVTSFPRLMLEMAIVLTIMSVDTALVIISMTTALGMILFLLLFSAVVRLLFIERLVGFVQTYPAVRVFILVLLVMIGSELIVQGLGLDVEVAFNVLLVAALLVFIAYRRQSKRVREKD